MLQIQCNFEMKTCYIDFKIKIRKEPLKYIYSGFQSSYLKIA